MKHYQRLKNIFDVMEEGHLLLEPISNLQGGYEFIVRECNDSFLTFFSLHKDIVVNRPLNKIGVISDENYLKLSTLLDDVFTSQKPGKRDVFFSNSMVDATVVATACDEYIDLLLYNWSRRDTLGTTSELNNLLRVFVNRQLCYLELNNDLEVVRLIGDVDKTLHVSRSQVLDSKGLLKDLIYYKDYDLFYQSAHKSVQKERNTQTIRMLGSHGEKVWVRLDYIKIGQIISVIVENIDHEKKMEAAYHKEKNVLRDVQRLTQTGDWEWDLATDQYRISEGLMHLLDIAPKEVDNLKDFYKDRLTVLSSEMNQTMMGHENIYEYLKGDGNRIWLSDKHKKRYDAYGNLVSVFGVTQEITHHKELYDQIVQMNSEYEHIYHSVKAGILLVKVLENGHFVYANINTEALGLFDITTEEIIDKSPEMVMDDLGGRLLRHYTNCVKNKESIRVLEKLNRYGKDYRIIFLLSPTLEEGRVTKIVVSALESF